MVEWTGSPILTTPRLVLRTFRMDDLPEYAGSSILTGQVPGSRVS